MSQLLTRLTLCLAILRANRPGHWLRLAQACDQEASRQQWRELLARLAAEDAADAAEAEQLLTTARQILAAPAPHP
jgi:predicted secreted protein